MTSDIIFAFVGGIAVGVVAGMGIANRLAGRKYERQTFQMAKERTDLKAKNEDLQSQIEKLAAKDRDFAEHISERMGPEDDRPLREPCVISMEEYQFGYPYTENQAATYYQGNGILLDERGEVVDNMKDILGDEGMWACENTEDDTVYIHNDALNINYEVDIRKEAYDFEEFEDDDLEED